MTRQQLYLFNGFYLVILVVVAVLTRATGRRVAGALAGGVSGAALIALWQHVGWWHMVFTWEPHVVTLEFMSAALNAFVFLLTWRIARRFGGRGLAVVVVFAAVIGPPRDYWYMQHFPEWGYYAPGVAPLLAVSVTYVVVGVVGHAAMRLVAGPAGEDRLAVRHRPRIADWDSPLP